MNVSKDKSCVVDLRGYGYTPQKDKGRKVENGDLNNYFSTGKKSMVGESNFVPVSSEHRNPLNDAMADPMKISGFTEKENEFLMTGNTSKLILGTENSEIKARIDLQSPEKVGSLGLNRLALDESNNG